MDRSHFLTLALSAGMGSVAAFGSERAVPRSLSAWAAAYGFSVSDNGDLVSVTGAMRSDRLARGLQELASLSESAMRAEGNELRGTTGARPFQVRLKPR